MYMSVPSTYMVYACLYLFITLRWCSVQATSKNSAGCVRLDINLLKPSRIEFAEDPSTDDRKDAAQLEKVRVERGAETRRRRKADRA